MTTDSKPRIKITYATLSADNEELHSGFEAAVTDAKTKLGWHYKNYIDGEWRDGAESFETRSPGGRVHQRPPDGVLRRHGDRGREEPHRGARRGRGVRGPAALLLPDHGG